MADGAETALTCDGWDIRSGSCLVMCRGPNNFPSPRILRERVSKTVSLQQSVVLKMSSGNAGLQQTQYEEQYELTEDGRLFQPKIPCTTTYNDGSSINWLQVDMTERSRQQILMSGAGVRGIICPALDAACVWFVVIFTGMGIGIAGAWLDVLVKWYVVSRWRISDTRWTSGWGIFARVVVHMDSSIIKFLVVAASTVCQQCQLFLCGYHTQCRSGGEVCRDWQSWSTYLNFNTILGSSLLQSFVYIALAVSYIPSEPQITSHPLLKITFAATAAILVVTYAP